MTKIKLKPKSSAETEAYGAFKGVDYNNAIVEAVDIWEEKGMMVAKILGSELINIGVMQDRVNPKGLYLYADFDIVEG